MPQLPTVINLVRRKRPRAGRVIQNHRRLARLRELQKAREEFLRSVCGPDVNQGVPTDQIPETPVSIDLLQTISEEPELTEEVPVRDLSLDSDSEAKTIVDFENCPEIQISSVYSLYACEKRMSHEGSRPVPRIRILKDRILPALERVDLRQFFLGHPVMPCAQKEVT